MSAIITLTCVFHHLHAVIHVLAHMHASTDGIADPGFSRQVLPTTKWGVNLLLPSARSCEGYVFTRVCHSVQGGCLSQCMLWYHHRPGSRHPPETATVADSTHPTGMHSCSTKFCLKTAQKMEVSFAKRRAQAMLNIYSLHSLYTQIDLLWIFNL